MATERGRLDACLDDSKSALWWLPSNELAGLAPDETPCINHSSYLARTLPTKFLGVRIAWKVIPEVGKRSSDRAGIYVL